MDPELLYKMNEEQLEKLIEEATERMWYVKAEKENIAYPAFVKKNGERVEFSGYGVHKETCDIMSIRQGEWKKREGTVNRSGYVQVSFGKNANEYAHRVIAYTLGLEVPTYPGISEDVWENTPKEVKRILLGKLEVHHIDHNKENNHISNLMLVSSEQNKEAYQEHRKSSESE